MLSYSVLHYACTGCRAPMLLYAYTRCTVTQSVEVLWPQSRVLRCYRDAITPGFPEMKHPPITPAELSKYFFSVRMEYNHSTKLLPKR